MHPIPQVRNAPGEPVDSELPPSLIKIVGPELAVWFLAGEPMRGSRSNGAENNDPLHLIVFAMFLPTPFELPLWSPHTPQIVRFLN
jgi:hypothetical protein